MKRFSSIVCVLACITAASPAAAHPHVWVAVAAEVLYDGGAVSGVRHRWTFDDMYSAMAVEGLDTNGDGTYDAKELEELAKVNVESLHEFGYFTDAKIEGEAVAFAEPVDYHVERDAKGSLALVFTLPLKQPIKLGTLKLDLAIYDPSYFIAFSFAAKDPIKLAANAPAGCTVTAELPKPTASQQSLGEAFFGSSDAAGYSDGLAPQASVTCAS
jgi:ABC-type uncharacterized transport system substrate-binding protein